MKVKDIYNKLNDMADFSIQENWDNSGLLIGSLEKEVNKVLVCLDIDANVIDIAREKNIDLIITHHPVIFNSIKVIEADNIVYKLIQLNISVISAHTNIDFARGGINDILGELFEIQNPKTLISDILNTQDKMIGIVGELEKQITAQEMIENIKEKLNINYIKMSNIDLEKNIKKIAICGGAGGDFIENAIKQNCDMYITADLKHNHYIDNIGKDIILIDAGHYNTENVIVPRIKKELEKEFSGMEVIEYSKQPYMFV